MVAQEHLYEASDISHLSWKKRFEIKTVAFICFLVIRLIGPTIRWEPGSGMSAIDDKRSIVPEGESIIYAFWHNRTIASCLFFQHRGIVVMTSQSNDGEIIARVVRRFGYGTARGSASRGSVQALKGMARILRGGRDVAFTIDGPKGPRYVAKPGAILLARLTGCPVLPMCATIAKGIELKSWDRFRVPFPFSRARVDFGPPIYVPRDASEAEIDAKQAELQAALDRLQAESERWRETT